MTQLLFESPILIGSIGVLLAIVAIIVWTQVEDAKAQKASLYSAIGLLLIASLLVMMSVQVETDSERIRRMLHSVAASVEENDHPAVLAAIHSDASQTVRSVEAMLSRVTFRDARVTRIKSVNIEEGVPRTAVVEIIVVVSMNLEGTGRVRAPRFVKVFFTQQNDRWLVRNFEHYDVGVGLRKP